MNKGKITELLKTKGMEYDETSSSWYGVVSGISVMFTHSEDGRYYNIVIPVTNGGLPDKQSMKDIASQEKTVSAVTVKQYNVSFMVKNALTDNAYLENISTAISALPILLKNAGWSNCCEVSGRRDNLMFCVAGGRLRILCDEEFAKVERDINNKNYANSGKRENIVTGIVGALLGSIIGVISIVIVGQLGYVAVIPGIIMGVCTVKGYSLMAGKLSKAGAVISAVIMLLMTYVASVLDIYVYYLRQSSDAITHMEELMQLIIEYTLTETEFRFEFLKLLLFTVIGAVPAMVGLFRQEKLSVVVYKVKEIVKGDEWYTQN